MILLWGALKQNHWLHYVYSYIKPALTSIKYDYEKWFTCQCCTIREMCKGSLPSMNNMMNLLWLNQEAKLISLLILSTLCGFLSEKYILPAPIISWNHNVSSLYRVCQSSWRKTRPEWNSDKTGQISVLKQDVWIPVKYCGLFTDGDNARVTAEVRNKNKSCAITFIHPWTDYLF